MGALKGRDTTLFREALRYAQMGYPVFPLAPRSKIPLKRPQLGLDKGFKDATTNPHKIKRWFRAIPNANLAVALPAGTLVLDIDAPETRTALEQRFPDLARAPLARTGSGGWHLWVRTDVVLSARARALPGYELDLRVGGRSYIIVPPSIHPNGNNYSWVRPLTTPPSRLPLLPPVLASVLQQNAPGHPDYDPTAPPPPPQPPPDDERLARRQRNYALKELESRSNDMRRVSQGARHNELIRHLTALVGWYKSGALSCEEILEAMLDAAGPKGAGLPDWHVRHQVDWMCRNSRVPPKTLPERR